MKKLFSIILAFAMLFSLCSVTAFAAVTGDGSEENPYLVSSEAELNEAINNASGTNNHIKVTADITLTSSRYIRKSVVIDFNKKTVTGNHLIMISADSVTVKNGVFSNTMGIQFSGSSDFVIENMEIIGEDFYLLRISNSSGTIHNCYVETTEYYAANFMADEMERYEETNEVFAYSVVATQLDMIGSGRAYILSNQLAETIPLPEPGDQVLYRPHAYYNFTLDGKVISDENSGVNQNCDSPTYIGGYNRDWLIDSRDVNVVYDVDPTYTVTIPAEVTLGETATVSAENVILPKGKEVNVSVESDFTVKNANGTTLSYKMQKDNANGDEISTGQTVLTVNPDTASTGQQKIYFSLPNEKIKHPGEYKGTVTFNVAVKEVQQ